jgi:uncharacterized protein YybS (DUF2232 family)
VAQNNLHTEDKMQNVESAVVSPWRGSRAVFGAVVAVVGVLAAANPQSAVLKALNEAVPQLADAVPTLITACGALIAAFSHPPQLGR